MKFFQLFVEGKADLDDFDDYVSKWHDDPSAHGTSVFDYLGMTEEQYGLFVTNPQAAEKFKKIPLGASFKGRLQDKYRIKDS